MDEYGRLKEEINSLGNMYLDRKMDFLITPPTPIALFPMPSETVH